MCVDNSLNKPVVCLSKVLQNEKIGSDIFHMVIEAPKIALGAMPGQFIHIRCSKALSPLLRRPISIAGVDAEKGILDIIYRVVGNGTKLIAEKRAGDVIDIMGPLGKGFPLPEDGKTPILVGGGIGVAPLLSLAQAVFKAKLNTGKALIGFTTDEEVYGTEFLKLAGFDVFVTTDDGSFGQRGFPTDLLPEHAKGSKDIVIYGCGPKPLLKKLITEALNRQVPAYISLEQYMACGIGACLGCSIKSSGKGYKKVCEDGPVFEAREVDFGEDV